jgi:hypothetical protein
MHTLYTDDDVSKQTSYIALVDDRKLYFSASRKKFAQY